ncbi:glutaredoxin-2, mitochondrial-like [Mytilus edulis]|uniref:Glutaredoxin-2, mitochondrial n=1 Tax=Mytilus galloprovincialis TaxID=29158 RepID=A0A8B6FGT7_MYTGA|nr:glutaredoxin 3 [Mytilus galloprovincialis]
MGSQQSSSPSQNKPPTFDTEEHKFIFDNVHNNCVTVFSKTSCIHCTNTKKLFNEIGVPYKAIEINKMESGHKVQEVLADITKQNTVPRVFVNGECIGGASDTRALHQAGQLLRMIQKCKIK